MQASREDKRLKGRCNFIVFKRAYVKIPPETDRRLFIIISGLKIRRVMGTGPIYQSYPACLLILIRIERWMPLIPDQIKHENTLLDDAQHLRNQCLSL